MAKTLKQAAKNSMAPRWDEPIKSDMFQIGPKNTRVRINNHIVTVRSHWIEFHSEKKKGLTGYSELCLNWDPATDTETDNGCPMCAEGMRATEHHYAYLINRTMQKKTGNIVVHPVRLTNKLANSIVKLSEIVYDGQDEAPDATDPKGGFDIFLRQEDNNGKVDYVANASDKSPLTKEERAAFEAYISEKDVAVLAKPRPRTEVTEKLKRFNVIEGGKGQSGGSSGGKKPQKTYDEYDQESVPAGDGDDDGDPASPPPKKAGAGKAKPVARTSVSGDDDDETEAVKPGKDKRKLPWNEDDEEGPERSYATPDADDAPDSDEE